MRVGIVGGGLAGLTAAYELARRGHEVALFEREEPLGGQASTFELEGQRLEKFYHHIFASDIDIINLIEELGLRNRLEWLDSRVGFLHGGKVYDFVTPMDLMRFAPLSAVDRVRLGIISLYLRRSRGWRRLERTTAKAWLMKYGGKRNYRVVWGPLLRNKFGASHDEVSMAWLWGKVHLRFTSRQGGRERLGYMRDSFGVLIDALVDRITGFGGQIHTSSTVGQIVVKNGRAVGLQLGWETHPFDAVIATVPSPALLRMVPQMPEDYARKLERVRYQMAVCLVLIMEKPLTDIYWMNISDPTMPFVALIEHTNLVDASVYGGKNVLYVSNYLSPEDHFASFNGDELLNEYIPHLKKVNPEFEPSWVDECYLFREEAGQPIVTTGYSAQMPGHRTPIRGLYLANTTQIYPEDRGMNYSVRLGRRVADLVNEDA
ncbi:MAG: NAD(P)/FAD-dependent oxidoreductase [Chloroflexota bacterium]